MYAGKTDIGTIYKEWVSKKQLAILAIKPPHFM
jgi:hypothetical protein